MGRVAQWVKALNMSWSIVFSNCTGCSAGPSVTPCVKIKYTVLKGTLMQI